MDRHIGQALNGFRAPPNSGSSPSIGQASTPSSPYRVYTPGDVSNDPPFAFFNNYERVCEETPLPFAEYNPSSRYLATPPPAYPVTSSSQPGPAPPPRSSSAYERFSQNDVFSEQRSLNRTSQRDHWRERGTFTLRGSGGAPRSIIQRSASSGGCSFKPSSSQLQSASSSSAAAPFERTVGNRSNVPSYSGASNPTTSSSFSFSQVFRQCCCCGTQVTHKAEIKTLNVWSKIDSFKCMVCGTINDSHGTQGYEEGQGKRTTSNWIGQFNGLQCSLDEVKGRPPSTQNHIDEDIITEEDVFWLATHLRPSCSDDDNDDWSQKKLSLAEYYSKELKTEVVTVLPSESAPHIECSSSFEWQTEEDVEQELVNKARKTFSSLANLNQAFRRDSLRIRAEEEASGAKPSPSILSPYLPRYRVISIFHKLILARPRVLHVIEEGIASILERPWQQPCKGPPQNQKEHESCENGGEKQRAEILFDDGGWAVILINSIFLHKAESDIGTWRWPRFLGLLANSPNEVHHSLVKYLSSPNYPAGQFLCLVERVISFIAKAVSQSSQESIHDRARQKPQKWEVVVSTKVAALLFAAHQKNPRHPMSIFYCTVLDTLGTTALTSSFVAWETRSAPFSFCQYPFLLSLGAKIDLLNFDVQRQKVERAQESARSAMSGGRDSARYVPYLILTVRRSHILQDSLTGITRLLGGDTSELKKGLKIEFADEEGIDGGGLLKEWFLILFRQLFDPLYGMFTYEEETKLCWFNSASVDDAEFHLVGIMVGLATYNTATIDLPLPPVAYKRLMNEAVTLTDLNGIRPGLCKGLQALLDYEGDDVEDVFGLVFEISVDRWGIVEQVPLIEDGNNIAVSKQNRLEYVEAYVQFVLCTSIQKQFHLFYQGFHQIVAGNALSLFRGEELELVVRGSMEPLDLEQLKSETEYDGFHSGGRNHTVEFFWQFVGSLESHRQRQLLSFITGSDRIPATGTAALHLKLTNLGPDEEGRYPTSHTCFNQLCLYEYKSLAVLSEKLTRAMEDRQVRDLCLTSEMILRC